MNNVSFVYFGTHINSSANKTVCNIIVDEISNNMPTKKYIYVFFDDKKNVIKLFQINKNLKLTTLPQLNGNINAMADTSKNINRQVISIENNAENIINRNRPNNGSKNNPT